MPHALKNSLRRDFRDRRAGLGATARAEAGARICNRIIALPVYEQAAGIAAYWPLPEEVDIRILIEKALNSNRAVYLPRVVSQDPRLDFCPFEGDPASLVPGPFGLSEPRSKPAAIDRIDMIIVPGLAFDMHRHRLGYGAGYYDRFLKLSHAARVGVAFDVQTIDILPVAEHDVAMDEVVTESRVF